VSILYLLFANSKIDINKKTVLISMVSLLILTSILAIYIKSDSSLGRLLIYKISWNMFAENFISGIGIGNFQREYNLYQAQYFQSGQFSTKEFLLAGNSFYAFNDYWQFVIEKGVQGILLILITTYILFVNFKKRHKDTPNDQILKFLTAIFIIICVAAFFTHVFNYKPFRVIVIIIILYILLPRQTIIVNKYFLNLIFPLLTLIVFTSQYYFEIKNINNYRRLEKAKILLTTGYINESISIYNKLFTSLKNDISFLKEYADALEGTDNLTRKLQILNIILSQYSDNSTFLKLAKAYEEMGKYNLAEKAYLQSVNMVPNKFVPKELLYRFYIRHNRKKEAEHWKQIILTMPVKIPSERIFTIKKNIERDKI
jgi:tetratricopeptide (TPR) repeat protein